MRIPFVSIFLLFCLPIGAYADSNVPILDTPTFENQQSLSFSAKISESDTPLLDQGTVPIPTGIPLTVSYTINHTGFWPVRNEPSEIQDAVFNTVVAENDIVLDLWQGTPFTDSAHMIQTWDITNKPTGEVSTTFPEAGPYFLVAYFPSAFYQDPETDCSNKDIFQTNCVASYSLRQMQTYFSTSLLGNLDQQFYPYVPDAFGGTQFTAVSLETHPQASNILFLPGIEGSRLYTRDDSGKEQRLWEPSVLSNMSELALNPDGASKREIYTRDLVDYTYGIKALGAVYGPLEDFLDGLVSHGTIQTWRAYPYDWREDVQDILSKGTLAATATSSPTKIYLQDVVQDLASTSPTGKVTIIAHSNGGLLAKALAIELEKEGRAELIDHIILIGSPQFGTPLTIGALLNGDGQTDPTGGLIMYGGDVRASAVTMPGMYGLLPSDAYFAHVPTYPVFFDSTNVQNFYEKYFGQYIDSATTLHDFLSDKYGLRSNFPSDDVRTPLALSTQIIDQESTTHSLLDSWTPPDGITLTTIAGWGNLTPIQYHYSNSDSKYINCFRESLFLNSCAYSYRLNHVSKNTEDGDDTVVSMSALGNTASSSAFYFNAKEFKDDKLGTIGHGNLTAAAPIQKLLTNIITGGDKEIPYISSTSPSADLQSLAVISVHSPMNIIATDANGNQTGIFPVPDHDGIYFSKEDIPGSSLQLLDDEKYLYLPKDTSYEISLQGYDAGMTTIDFGSMDANGEISSSVEFDNIPTNASTTASFTFDLNSDASSTLPTSIPVDAFGNGSTTLFNGTLSNDQIFSVLKNNFSKLSVRRGIKNRFMSVLLHIQKYSDESSLLFLKKLIQAQMGIKLTSQEGVFFLQLLGLLKIQT